MFKASQLVEFCLSMVGMPYWFGTCVYKCTTDVLKSKTNQYPSYYTDARMPKYKDAITKKKVCADCIGLIKGFFWTNGGEGVLDYINGTGDFTCKYKSNGCPDQSASGMLSWSKSKGCKNGKIASLPDVPGVLVYTPNHVGVYVGDGYAVEARGFDYGIVKTKIKDRTWTDWAYLPESLLYYDEAGEIPKEAQQTPTATEKAVEKTVETAKTAYNLGDRTLQRGSKGDDVSKLQECLINLGYDLGTYGSKKDGVDGNMGTKTVNAVKEFQAANDLEVDGKYGKKSHAAMMKNMQGATKPESGFKIKVTSWSVNVRNAPNMQTGKVMRIVRMNKELDAVGVDKATGWYKLADGNYISNEFTERV